MSGVKLHVLLTGPPGAGKTTVGNLVAQRLGASFLDTRTFHNQQSRFTAHDAQQAFTYYTSALDIALAESPYVVTEGVFLENFRRERVWRLTAKHGARLIPFTLMVPEEEMLSRLSARTRMDHGDSLTSTALLFRQNFEKSPWGRVYNTENLSPQVIVESIVQDIVSYSDKQFHLTLYFDNTTWDTLFSALDRHVPLPGSRAYSALAETLDGLVWADAVSYLEFTDDEAYRHTSDEIALFLRSSWGLTTLLSPAPVPSEIFHDVTLDALRDTVDQFLSWRDRGVLMSTIQDCLHAGRPQIIEQKIDTLNQLLAQTSEGILDATSSTGLAAVDWFLDALRNSPSQYSALRALGKEVPLQHGEYFIATHRLFRCLLHLYFARAAGSVYWPTARRRKIIQLGFPNPINRIRREITKTGYLEFLQYQLHPGVDVLTVTAPLPFWGLYILSCLPTPTFDRKWLLGFLLALRDDEDVRTFRALVRRVFSTRFLHPSDPEVIDQVQAELQTTLDGISRSLGTREVRIAQRQLGLRLGPSSDSQTDASPDNQFRMTAQRLRWMTLAASVDSVVIGPPTRPEQVSTTKESPHVTILNNPIFNQSIVNIDSNFQRVLQKIDSASEPSREEVRNLFQALHEELKKAPPHKIRDAEAVSDIGKDLIDKSVHPSPNKRLIEVTAQGLKDAAQALAEVVPKVLPLVEQIIQKILSWSSSTY